MPVFSGASKEPDSYSFFQYKVPVNSIPNCLKLQVRQFLQNQTSNQNQTQAPIQTQVPIQSQAFIQSQAAAQMSTNQFFPTQSSVLSSGTAFINQNYPNSQFSQPIVDSNQSSLKALVKDQSSSDTKTISAPVVSSVSDQTQASKSEFESRYFINTLFFIISY